MSTFAVGDIQGCFETFQALLEKMDFPNTEDRLILLGDIVNRGPSSLDTLRLVYSLRHRIDLVLGNHDLYLIGLWLGVFPNPKPHTMNDILQASDKDDLVSWLIERPLILKRQSNVLVHAGIYPLWSIKEACEYAQEIGRELLSERVGALFAKTYQTPRLNWRPRMNKAERLAFALRTLVFMRMLHDVPRLDWEYTGNLLEAPPDRMPWFILRSQRAEEERIYFGHWASLGLFEYQKRFFCLDSGCVWGGMLSAMDIANQRIIQIEALERPSQIKKKNQPGAQKLYR